MQWALPCDPLNGEAFQIVDEVGPLRGPIMPERLEGRRGYAVRQTKGRHSLGSGKEWGELGLVGALSFDESQAQRLCFPARLLIWSHPFLCLGEA